MSRYLPGPDPSLLGWGFKKEGVIRPEKGKFVLYTRDGSRILGRHDTYQDAIKQEYAIQKSKERQAKTAEQQVDGYTRKGPSGPVLVAPYSRRGEPARHVLVTGHSAAGKSTYAAHLGRQLGLPVMELDHEPELMAFFQQPHESRAQFTDEERAIMGRVVDRALAQPEPYVIEGTALLAHPEKTEGHRRVLVDAERPVLLRRRVDRARERAAARGEAWTSVDEARKRQSTEDVYQKHEPAVEQFRRLPGVEVVRTDQDRTKKPAHEDLPREEVIGIPDRKRFVPIPTVEQPAVWSYALQEHDAERRGKHLDLRLGHDGNAFSWALAEWPAPGKSTWAIEQPTHTTAYMKFQGRIPEGYGKGDVRLKEHAEIIVHEAGPGKVVFSIIRGRSSEDVALLHVGKDDPRVWIAVNMSPKLTAIQSAQYKPKFRSGLAEDLDPEKPDTVWSAKIDGAHGLLLLEGGKRARVFSYREPAGGEGLIEWTHKIPGLFQQKAPKSLKDTLLRVEAYAQKDGRPIPVEQVAGLLNQSILGSRIAQKEGPRLRLALIDVERYRGADVSKQPWSQKDLILDAVQRALPFFERPEQARTPKEKRALLERIRQKKHLQTEEGVIERPLGGGTTRKGVLKETDDVHVTGTFPARAGSKYEGKAVGGFTYAREPGGPTVGRVGTGLSDALRRELHEQPNRYLGAIARVRGKKYTSGSGRGAAFVGWHPDWLAAQEKTADVIETFKPFPHQIRPLKQYIDNDGVLVLAAGPGSGKTYTAIVGNEIQRSLGKAGRALVVTPTGLRLNFAQDGVQKFTNSTAQIVGNQQERSLGYKTVDEVGPDADYTVVGYELFRTDPIGLMERTGADTLILDEFHTIRNEDSITHQAAKQARRMARNFIGLTGSLINNDPAELAPLLDVALNDGFLTRQQFSALYKRKTGETRGFFGGHQPQYGLVNLKDLQKRVGAFISYMDTKDLRAEDMPKKDTEFVDVQMSDHQRELYEWALNKVGPVAAFKIRNNLPVSQREAKDLFAMLAAARKASNSVATLDRNVSLEQSAEQTPKVKRLLDDLQEHLETVPDAQIVVYTNLIQGGIDVLHAGLQARGIPHGIFIGTGQKLDGDTVSTEARAKAVQDFQSGKVKVIVLSGAGKEGLDLKNATAFLSLDGHFNPERILQAEARAVRLKGLEHRPQAEREVMVRRYRSVLPQPGFWARLFGGSEKEFSTDEWTYNAAQRKFVLNRILDNAVKAVSSAVPDPEHPLKLNVNIPYVPETPAPTATATATRAPTTPATSLSSASPEQKPPEIPPSSTPATTTATSVPAAGMPVPGQIGNMPQPLQIAATTATATTTPAPTTPATPLSNARPNRYLPASLGAGAAGGYWRKLPSGYVGHGPAGEQVPGRTWVDLVPA